MNFKLIFFLAAALIVGVLFVLSKDKKRFLLFLLCFFYVFPVGWIFYHFTGILLVDFPLIALLGLLLFSGKRVKFFVKGFSLPVLLIILGMSAASFVAIRAGWSWAEISKWVRGYLVLIVVANSIEDGKDLNTVITSLLVGFLFQSFLAAYQWRVGTLGLWFLGERLFRSEPWRSYGTFYVPSFLANYLIVILPIVMRLGVFYRHPDRMKRGLYFGSFLLGGLALYTTYGRSAWIGFVVSAALIFMFSLFKSKLRPRLKWPIAFLMVLGVAFLIKYMPAIERQFGRERKGAVDIRFIQYQVAWRLIQDNPYLGAGPGNYELLARKYIFYVPDFPQWLLWEMVHNSYLLITAENGIFTGLMFLIFLFQYFRLGYKLLKSRSPFIVNLSLGIMGGILAIVLSFLASPDIHNEQTINQLMIVAGLLLGLDGLNEKVEKRYQMKKAEERRKWLELRKAKEVPRTSTT